MLQEACFLGSLPGVEETMRIAGKLFISFYLHHSSLGSLILIEVSLASRRDHGRIRVIDLDREIISGFSDIIKRLIEISNEHDTSHEMTILKLLSMIEEKVKEVSGYEKQINFGYLLRSLIEVDHMISNERYHSLKGRELIVARLQHIFSQFPVIEDVMVLPRREEEELLDSPQ